MLKNLFIVLTGKYQSSRFSHLELLSNVKNISDSSLIGVTKTGGGRLIPPSSSSARTVSI